MRMPFLVILSIIACSSFDRTDGHSATQEHDSVGYVLQLGRRMTSDAKHELLRLRSSASSNDARRLASRMLLLWNDDKRTFFSESPLPLHRDCVDEMALLSLRKQLHKTTSVDLLVAIDATGVVSDVTVRTSSGVVAADDLIVNELRKQRFLPAKPGDDYVSATLLLKCRIEAR